MVRSTSQPLDSSLTKTLVVILVGACLITFGTRLFFLPPFIEHIDGIFFSYGVERYSTLNLSPFWPGYPVYMWLGKFVNLFVNDSPRALHLLSALCSALSVIPLGLLAHAWSHHLNADKEHSLIATGAVGLLWCFTPLPWFLGTEVFSDSVALLFALFMLWLVWLSAVGKHPLLYGLIAAVLGGLAIGVRLSYLPLLIVLFVPLWTNRKTWHRISPLLMIAAFLATVALWLGWQFWMEGRGYIQAGQRLLSDHFAVKEAGSATSDPQPLLRPWRFAVSTFVYGMGIWQTGAPLTRVLTTLVWLVLLPSGLINLFGKRPPLLLTLLGLWFVPFVFWIIVVHNVDWARYAYPIVATLILLAALGLPKARAFAVSTLAIACASLLLVSFPLILEHQRVPPLHWQLTDYLNQNLEPSRSVILYADNPHVLYRNAPDFDIRLAEYDFLDGQAASLMGRGADVYTLSETFEQSGERADRWQVVARFCQNRFITTGLSDSLTLYKYVDRRTKTNPLPCQPVGASGE